MHTIYEYLFTGLIIVAIVVASATMLTSISMPLKMISEREQLKVTTEKLLSQVLLSTGSAPLADGTVTADWGRNLNVAGADLTSFGLAKQSETTRESFVLDVDKVQRLNFSVNSLRVEPRSVATSLQLGNDYGFALEIFPVLNVTVRPPKVTGSSEEYPVLVRNNEGMPIPGASVTAEMYYIVNGYVANLSASSVSGTPKELGNFTVSFDTRGVSNKTAFERSKTLALSVDYEGTRSIQFRRYGTGTYDAYVLGDCLFHSGSAAKSSGSIFEVITYRRGSSSYFRNVTFTLTNATTAADGGYARYQMSYLEPSAIGFMFDDGSKVWVASRSVFFYGPGGFSTIPSASTFPLGSQLQRVVTIADQAYVFRLYLWRMSW